MTSRLSPNPLRLELARSRYLFTYLLLSHAAVLAVVFVALWPSLWLLPVVPAVIGSAVYQVWGWYRRRGVYAPIALRFADGAWYLTLADGVERGAVLREAQVSRGWLTLRLRAARTHTVLVFPDSADTDAIRRLRVLLRFGGGASSVKDSPG